MDGLSRKHRRKKSQHANYIAAQQNQKMTSMVTGVSNVNYKFDGNVNPYYHNHSYHDEQENGSLTYSASSTGESTDSSFADSSLRMNDIDPANLQLSGPAFEMLFKQKASVMNTSPTFTAGRSFPLEAPSFAADSLGYSEDDVSFSGFADSYNFTTTQTGQPSGPDLGLRHKSNITGTHSLQGSVQTIEPSAIRTPTNASPLARRTMSSSPATVVPSDVSLSSNGTPSSPPPRHKASRGVSSNLRRRLPDEYDDEASLTRDFGRRIPAGSNESLSYQKWWMCGFTDAFNFNS